MNKVFVYGTLKKGNNIRGLDRFGTAQFVDQAVTVDATYSLYDLGAFPAVTLGGENTIQGEVWQVDDATFDVLDGIEGYPEFYNRIKISTTAGNAWIYYIPNITEYPSATQITGGKAQAVEWN